MEIDYAYNVSERYAQLWPATVQYTLPCGKVYTFIKQ